MGAASRDDGGQTDNGQPRNETLYGTETSLKTTIAAGHGASVRMYADFVPNHEGFRLQPKHKLYLFMTPEPDFARIVSLYFATAVALAIAVVVLLQLRPQVRHRLLLFGAATVAGVYGLISWLR